MRSLALLVACAACSAGGGHSSSSSGGTGGSGFTCAAGCPAPFSCDQASGLCKNEGVPSFSHAWVIVMENTSYSSLNGSSSAPYLNSLWAAGSGPGVEMTNFSDANVHPSLPNYIALAGGDNFGITSDGPAAQGAYQVAASNPDIASQLEAAGLTWHSYSEAQTSPCQLSDSGNDGTPPGRYASKHNPMPHFLVTQQNAADCQANDVSYEPEGAMPGLAADTQAGKFFDYVFVDPNLCDDGHDTCAPLNDPVKQQDQWLQANLPILLGSSAYATGGVVFLTWDEGESDGDHILTVILSPLLKTPGSTNGTAYSHYSTLATIEAGFGLANLPAANGHHDALITDVWK